MYADHQSKITNGEYLNVLLWAYLRPNAYLSCVCTQYGIAIMMFP